MKTAKKTRVLLNTGAASEQELSFNRQLDVRIVGQPDGKAMASRAYRRFLNPLRDKRRPVYVAYLLGEKGSGKTLTAEMVAEILHGDPTAFIKVNCGNYKEKHRVSQLLGAPPSYVGYKDPSDPQSQPKPGQLDPSAKLSMANKVASRKGSSTPISIVLFDEAEKMAEELEDVLLSIMDKGEVDFGNNTVGDFTDCIILLAGNVGAFELSRLKKRMGFRVSDDVAPTEVRSTVEHVLNERYKPEFLDRLDEVVIYQALTADEKRAVVDVEITRLEERIMSALPRGLQFSLEVDKAAREFILSEALKGDGSARRVKRTVSKLLEEPLGNELIKHTITLGDLVEVTHEAGKDALSFYLCEGEAEVSEADRMLVHGDTADTMKGLGFQRRVDRATRKAARAEKQLFEVRLNVGSFDEMAHESASLVHDLRNVFGIQIVSTTNSWEAPYAAVVVVRAIQEQIDILKSKYPEAVVRQLPSEEGRRVS